ncbi:hypothetical protein BpHYR1_016807 [Brachionus plicatilis]|uniref:Uncharacterized protein n=1 Tax=Brachionus plicatilis TaxID=10195 RepID=A0A3M7PVN5_BRAPC|nr:hypothetical protein BpHYR1_016807 [Brachionus plicatilis]
MNNLEFHKLYSKPRARAILIYSIIIFVRFRRSSLLNIIFESKSNRFMPKKFIITFVRVDTLFSQGVYFEQFVSSHYSLLSSYSLATSFILLLQRYLFRECGNIKGLDLFLHADLLHKKGIVPLGSSERRSAFFSASLLIGNLKFYIKDFDHKNKCIIFS